MVTVRRAIQLASSRAEIRSVRDLVRALESDADRIEQVVAMILDDRFRPDRDLIKYARGIAAQLRGTTAESPADSNS